ncbi:MAG: mucoidy inhibitor MuiA family protein [Myxococcota bacterium]
MNAILLLLLGAATTTAADAPIDRVTVFSDRAEVTRQATAACRGRETVNLTFPLLPARLDVRTLRAEASAPARTIGVVSRLTTLEQPVDPEVAAIQREIQEIDDQREALSHRLTGVQERSSAAEAYAAYLQGVLREDARSETPRLERWSEALNLLQEERERAGREQLEVGIEQRELSRRRNLLGRKLQARTAVIGNEADRRGHQVTVTVDCNGARNSTIHLSYLVPGATWSPAYDLRFDSRGGDGVGPGRAAIEVGAIVRQATGEDWSNAGLVLTTARPRLGAEAPQPATIHVDGQEVGKQRVLVQDVEDRSGLPTGGLPAPPSEAGATEVEDGDRAFNLTIPGKVAVRTDARPYRFPVDTVSTDARGRRIAIPKLAPYVYRVVQLDNPASFPLLEGPMHVYRDGSYAGGTTLEYTAPGAPLEISLGADETVRVSRHDLNETDRSPGFLRSTRTMERAYRMELQNGNSEPVTVTLRENIPVSKVDDVRVTLEEEETSEGYDLDEERGILAWDVELPPDGEAEVDLAFTVRLPDHWELASH